MKRTDKRTLELGTIFVSGELFDFYERKSSMGDKLGKVDRFHGMSAEAIAEAKKNAAKRKKRAK